MHAVQQSILQWNYKNKSFLVIQQSVFYWAYELLMQSTTQFSKINKYTLSEIYNYKKYNDNIYLNYLSSYNNEVNINFNNTHQYKLSAYSCRSCILTFSNIKQLKTHLQNYHKNIYFYSVCLRFFSLKIQLNEHLQVIKYKKITVWSSSIMTILHLQLYYIVISYFRDLVLFYIQSI